MRKIKLLKESAMETLVDRIRLGVSLRKAIKLLNLSISPPKAKELLDRYNDGDYDYLFPPWLDTAEGNVAEQPDDWSLVDNKWIQHNENNKALDR